MLLRYLSHECVEFNCRFVSWEQSVYSAGLLLLRQGYILPAYIQRMIDSIKEFGSYLVFAKGIALAHAKPMGDVSTSAVSAVSIPRGVKFPNNGGIVRLVMAVAVDDPIRHAGLFEELAAFFNDSDAVSNAQQAVTFEELVNIICMNNS